MTKCTHCGRPNTHKAPWKKFIALYHEVEIKHSVCPSCSSVHFPKLYNVKEDTSLENRRQSFGFRKVSESLGY